ncbi:MAG TPA: low molecular weight protein arginine phosphatase [Candidatus Alectryocaccomicrobium excrementavium]|uniref:Low molecular weight protein arginine phosphatase n=1 Tax=Candidatus Alectryocaccomicrobium excrementavium TaxID=2840668 RepID=A0A9D1K5X4_9FIRM|nr:low molecular weight protein arginine phosphatase [Candidatus Alectryocaccomicrobium excrementavium]
MKIIMVCTANTCRSPMAEVLMRDALLSRKMTGYEVTSAGVFAMTGMPAMYEAIEVMDEYHLDLRYHRAKNFQDVYEPGSLVLCMTPAHLMDVKRMYPNADAHLLTEYALMNGSISDPFSLGVSSYRRAAADIHRAVNRIADRLQAQSAASKA